MSRWLLTPVQHDGRRHVVPGDLEGEDYHVIGGHIPSSECWCAPHEDARHELLIHNDRERGGFNA